MQVVHVDPRSDPLWQRLISRYESDALPSPEWIRVLTDTYGFDVGAYIVVDDAGAPCAGLPFCRIEDPREQRIAVLPFSDYCDPLVRDSDHWACLADQLLGNKCPVLVRCLHNPLPLADPRFRLASRAKWHATDLRPSLDTLWENLDGSVRRAIKKARRDGVVVKVAEREETLRAFYELHLKVRKYKYQLLAQPYRFFKNIWHRLLEPGHGALMVAAYQDTIIGGVLFLEWKDKLYYKFNASDPAHLSHRPNDMLIWEGIRYGKGRDYTRLDFGLSDWDQEGLLRYKRKFASEEKAISFLRYAPDTVPAQGAEQLRSVLPRLTDLFTDASVPDRITEEAGEVLYGLLA